LTVKEHLEFYANVKGVVRRFRQEIVEKQMTEMDLKEF
jgi:ABC-type multidrug transport system ATPase subunit